MPDRKLRVFLCHASQDKPIVRELYQRLLAEGWIDPWFDEEKLLPGQIWDIEIEKEVHASDAVIVCLSDSSVKKEGYVQKEIHVATNLALYKPEGAIYIIPLRLDDCFVPWRLKDIQYIDYFPKEYVEIAYQRLLSSLESRAQHLQINTHEIKDRLRQEEAEKARLEELDRKRIEEQEKERLEKLVRLRQEAEEKARLDELEQKRVEALEKEQLEKLIRARQEAEEKARLQELEFSNGKTSQRRKKFFNNVLQKEKCSKIDASLRIPVASKSIKHVMKPGGFFDALFNLQNIAFADVVQNNLIVLSGHQLACVNLETSETHIVVANVDKNAYKFIAIPDKNQVVLENGDLIDISKNKIIGQIGKPESYQKIIGYNEVSHLVAVSKLNKIHLVDFSTGNTVKSFDVSDYGYKKTASFNGNLQVVAVVSTELRDASSNRSQNYSQITIWEWSDNRDIVRSIQEFKGDGFVAFSADCDTLAVGRENKLMLYSLEQEKTTSEFNLENPITSLLFFPNSTFLVAALGRSIFVLDTQDGSHAYFLNTGFCNVDLICWNALTQKLIGVDRRNGQYVEWSLMGLFQTSS